MIQWQQLGKQSQQQDDQEIIIRFDVDKTNFFETRLLHVCTPASRLLLGNLVISSKDSIEELPADLCLLTEDSCKGQNEL